LKISISTKTVAQKLLIKPNYRVLLVNEPEGDSAILGELPDGATIIRESVSSVDLIQVFVSSKEQMEELLPEIKKLILRTNFCGLATQRARRKLTGIQSVSMLPQLAFKRYLK
jgi:hypothetical protein